MRVRRLSWAGLEITAGATTILVDYVENPSLVAPWAGEPVEPFLRTELAPGDVDAAVITHIHTDHFDPPALVRLLDHQGEVLCPPGAAHLVAQAAEGLTGESLTAREVEAWGSATVGDLRLTALPAVDGLGDAQVSWVVSDGSATIAHFGDTLWHGHWWNIRERCGPIDVAFLPINAAKVNYPHRQPASGIPAVLSPEQGVAAAHILGAAEAVPMHYGQFEAPGLYEEAHNAEARFARTAGARDVTVTTLEPGCTKALQGVSVP